MTTRGMAYDHPAYVSPLLFGGQMSGSGGAVSFAAFADMIARALNVKPVTAGTSADTVTVLGITGTTTRTLGVTTLASAQTAGTRIELTTGSNTLTALDAVRIVKGTDATGLVAASLEAYVRPGAALTDPITN